MTLEAQFRQININNKSSFLMINEIVVLCILEAEPLGQWRLRGDGGLCAWPVPSASSRICIVCQQPVCNLMLECAVQAKIPSVPFGCTLVYKCRRAKLAPPHTRFRYACFRNIAASSAVMANPTPLPCVYKVPLKAPVATKSQPDTPSTCPAAVWPRATQVGMSLPAMRPAAKPLLRVMCA